MATFVLVHGAWSGGHTFHLVRRRLQDAGHDVFIPTLTGLGERIHLLSPQVTLTTHVEDVDNVVLYWDLHEIVLLGYSYGGMVVTGALRRVGDRVAHLVYLDAFLPSDGESLAALAGVERPTGLGAPWLLPPTARPAGYYEDEAEAAFVEARRGLQPIATMTEPVRLDQPLESYPFSRTYIKATGEARTEPANPFWRAADRVRASSAWRYREIATNHAIPGNRPAELVEILLELV